MSQEKMRKTYSTIVQEKVYEVEEIDAGWVQLTCDGNHIAKLVDFEEARRVIWSYWTNLGVPLEYLTEADFHEVVKTSSKSE